MDDDLKRLLESMRLENISAHEETRGRVDVVAEQTRRHSEEMAEETRRHFDVVAERLDGKIDSVAELLSASTRKSTANRPISVNR